MSEAIYTNESGIPLSMAVYLATDHYDYDPNTISATGLLKPVRQQILSSRVPKGMSMTDIHGLVKSRIGTSIHDGVEKAWLNPDTRRVALKKLGYPDSVINRIVVNPDPDNLPKGAIPVYMEQRHYREIQGRRISGKYDFVAEGRLEDVKSTSTFTWMKQTKTEDYQLQGSIYRWLAPHIITQDIIVIQFVFTDWMAGKAMAEKKYPQSQMLAQKIPLLSLDDTEHFIESKLRLYDQYKNSHEQDLPPCNDKELWRKEAVFKYYASGKIAPRSTKNFDNKGDAYAAMQKAGKGIVVEVPGEVMACKYCAAFPICTQKDSLIADGSLKL